MLRRFLWVSAFALLFALAFIGYRQLPRAYNPFAPLHVADPLTPVTGLKLRNLRRDATICGAVLQTSSLTLAARPNAGSAECPLDADAVQVQSSTLRLSSSFLASCPLAVAYAMWEQHILQPLARDHFGSTAARVTHLGSYACRSVRGGTRQSEHASASAIDISSITLADGRVIDVQKHWGDAGRDGEFLRALHRQSCRIFSMALGPAYNAAHHNHFHLGTGGRFGLCR